MIIPSQKGPAHIQMGADHDSMAREVYAAISGAMSRAVEGGMSPMHIPAVIGQVLGQMILLANDNIRPTIHATIIANMQDALKGDLMFASHSGGVQ